jgi:hypothetical protein
LLRCSNGYCVGVKKYIKRRIRIRKEGLSADADVNAVISVNVSGSRLERSHEPSEPSDRSTEDDPGRPPAESEGGER